MKYSGWVGGKWEGYGYSNLTPAVKTRLTYLEYEDILTYWQLRLSAGKIFHVDTSENRKHIRWYKDRIGDPWPMLVSKEGVEDDYMAWASSPMRFDRSTLFSVLKPFIFYNIPMGTKVVQWAKKEGSKDPKRANFLPLPSHYSCALHWEMKTGEPILGDTLAGRGDFMWTIREQQHEMEKWEIRRKTNYWDSVPCGGVPHSVGQRGVL